VSVQRSRAGHISAFGESRSAEGWSQRNGVHPTTIWNRIQLGWDAEIAITTPPQKCQDGKTLTVGDETRTVREWSVITGVLPETIRRRMEKGWAPERVIWPRLCARSRTAKKVEYNGKMYSMGEVALMAGISLSTIYKRIRAGWNIDDLISPPRMKGKACVAVTSQDDTTQVLPIC
jgi:predicted DNA-binding transcriptional regulator AlpA